MTRQSSLGLVALTATVLGAGALVIAAGSGPKFQDVTLTGRLVDLQCFMTEQFPSNDRVRCTKECLRGGIPAALETEQGVVVIGRNLQGPRMDWLPYAFQEVELKGKLFEKHNLKYLEVASIRPLTNGDEDDVDMYGEDESEEDAEDSYPDPDDYRL